MGQAEDLLPDRLKMRPILLDVWEGCMPLLLDATGADVLADVLIRSG